MRTPGTKSGLGVSYKEARVSRRQRKRVLRNTGTASSVKKKKGVMKNKFETVDIQQGNRLKPALKAARLCVAAALLFICWSLLPGSGKTAFAAHQGSPAASRQMPAYYDGQLVTVNMFELPNSEVLIDHNASVNEIYAYDDLDEEQEFTPIIDAIQGEDFNPLWRQILIVFNPGFEPHQFVSEEEVEDAASGDNPEITLVETDEVYLCAVVRHK